MVSINDSCIKNPLYQARELMRLDIFFASTLGVVVGRAVPQAVYRQLLATDIRVHYQFR
jgi:hypothetical protein